MIAALYVEKGGVYYGLPDVDPWDEERDARLYDGPWPVVAHPPCASWSIMGNCRPATRARGDAGTFAAALDAVRRFGGVLEQPRYSRAWTEYGLPRPAARGWTSNLLEDGWTCEVDQRLYGHPAPKPTWLYYCGVAPPALRWGYGYVSDYRVAPQATNRRRRHPATVHELQQKQRLRTPEAFRDVLLDMARSAVPA
jgi:hypothetical protein